MGGAARPTRDDMVVTRWGARFMGRRFPVSIGRGGITIDKREGDGATPAGVWRMMEGGYRADRRTAPHAPMAFKPIGPRDLWSDDPSTPEYNHPVSAPYIWGHEQLRRADGLYNVFIVTDWNWPTATAGNGSAIFIHCWRGPRIPTAGCLAFRSDHLDWIVSHWTPRSRIFVIP